MSGLAELEKTLVSRELNYYRNKKAKREQLPYDELLYKKESPKKNFLEIAKEKIKDDMAKDAKVIAYSLKQYLKDLVDAGKVNQDFLDANIMKSEKNTEESTEKNTESEEEKIENKEMPKNA